MRKLINLKLVLAWCVLLTYSGITFASEIFYKHVTEAVNIGTAPITLRDLAVPVLMRYGAGDTWSYRLVTGPFSCDAAFFNGDPTPGVNKTCQVAVMPSTHTHAWTLAGFRGEVFHLVGNYPAVKCSVYKPFGVLADEIRYGANTDAVEEINSYSYAMDSSVDRCWVRQPEFPYDWQGRLDYRLLIPAWTPVAGEGKKFYLVKPMVVRYGADYSWIRKTIVGWIYCGNSTFGDPVPGAVKRCEVLNSVVQMGLQRHQ